MVKRGAVGFRHNKIKVTEGFIDIPNTLKAEVNAVKEQEKVKKKDQKPSWIGAIVKIDWNAIMGRVAI